MKSSYVKHISTIHMKHEEEEMMSDEDLDGLACVLCSETFVSDADLESHVNTVHETKEFTSDASSHTPTHFASEDKRSTRCLLCTVCKKQFTTKSNLRKHLINVHKAKMKLRKVFTKVCPLCPFASNSSSRIAMHRHFDEIHKISLKWERHSFKSFNEFDVWKTEVETNTVTSYIKHSSIKNNAITYHCHRSGSYKKRSRDVKRPKVLGSCKINAFCPSEMKVYVKSSGVEVYYLSTHVGHVNELSHLQLSVKDKSAVIARLEEDHACHEDILSSFNKSVTTDGELKRINLLRKHDIHNITTRYGLKKETVKKCLEPVSVQAFVKGLAQSDNIMLMVCKALGVYSDIYPNLKEEDFLLIYMSKNQNRILMKHGKGTVCMDFTTGKNFHLFTLSVLNDNGEGIPVAFMFTNKVEGSTLETFFEEIKRVCGTIVCKVFMSDIGEMVYSAWNTVMGKPNERIFSTWHVLESWRKNLDSKVENKEKREIMFNTLQSLICETDKDVFLKMLHSVLAKDEELRLFVDFFTKEFVIARPYKLWAHSYGTNAELNTSMSLENFNRGIRFSYMKGGKRQLSVEEAVIAALKLIMDKEFYMIFDMRLETLKQKRNSVRCKHKKSLSMDIAKVKQLGDMWKVFYTKRDNFYIVMRRGTCDSCQLQCFHCKTCYHEYTCSCLAYAIEKDMCEHIHLVVQSSSLSGSQNVVDTVEITDASPMGFTEFVSDTVENEQDESDQNVMAHYYSEEGGNVCQIEIIVQGETDLNYENGCYGQVDGNTYTLVENEEVANTYSLDRNHFYESEVVDSVIGNTQGFDNDPVPNLQEEKSKLVTEFVQFLDTKIIEMKQFDMVKRGMTKIMSKKWPASRRKSLKVNFELLVYYSLLLQALDYDFAGCVFTG